jgi:hypothetical protein
MDALITAAARALAAGNPLGALTRVALRDDAPALALRGIAMAQLGDLARARTLVRRAARAFGPKASVAHARCVIAEAEIAFASRDLGWSTPALAAARATLEAHGDRANAAHARLLAIRRLLLLGHLNAATRALADLAGTPLPPALRAVHGLIVAGIALRRIDTRTARAALARAQRAAQESRISALVAEVADAMRMLEAPAARRVGREAERPLRLGEVEALLASNALAVDACRHAVHGAGTLVPLASRPVLFALVRTLGEAWPEDVPRDALAMRAFHSKFFDASHRARLRVELGRLRKALRGLADVRATRRGFALVPRVAREVVVLAPPHDEKHAAILALLADGEAWSSSALALALDAGQRSIQRALEALATAGKVQSFGRGRARRWLTPPMPGFATTLLLPVPPAGD